MKHHAFVRLESNKGNKFPFPAIPKICQSTLKAVLNRFFVTSLVFHISSLQALAETPKEKAATAKNATLKILFQDDPPSLDPADAADALSQFWLSHLLEGLVRKNSKGQIEPAVASEITVNQDKTTHTFKIRPNAKWQDGRKIKAHDFVFAWRRLVDPKIGSEVSFLIKLTKIKNANDILLGLKPVESLGVQAETDDTLIVTTEASVSFFLELLTLPAFSPIDQNFMEKEGKNFSQSKQSFLSNGPFQIKSWQRQRALTLEKNSNYWDNKSIPLKEIQASVSVTDKNSQLQVFLSQQINFLPLGISSLKTAQKMKLPMKCQPNGVLKYAVFNHRKNRFFADKSLRLAFARAFPRLEFVNKIGGVPGDKIALGLIPELMTLSGSDVPYRRLVPVSKLLSTEIENSKPEASKKPAVQEPAGVRETVTSQQKNPITMLVGVSESSKEMGAYFKQVLQKTLGLEISLVSLPIKSFYQRANEGDFDFYVDTWTPDFNDPLTYFDVFTSSSPSNRGAWQNPEYDALVQKATNISDLTRRATLLLEAEKLLLSKDVAILPLIHNASCFIVTPGLTGVNLPLSGISPDFRFSNWNP